MTTNIQVSWLDASERTILMTYHDGEWTWDQHFAAAKRVQTFIESVSHPVHLIIDVSNVGPLPERIIVQLPELARFTLSPQINQLIIVGLHGILETAANIYSRSYRALMTVETLAEAQALVH